MNVNHISPIAGWINNFLVRYKMAIEEVSI
jgi:hypothetical protein